MQYISNTQTKRKQCIINNLYIIVIIISCHTTTMTLMRTNHKYILYTMISELILVFLYFKYLTLAEPLSYFMSSKKVQYNTSGTLLTFLGTCHCPPPRRGEMILSIPVPRDPAAPIII